MSQVAENVLYEIWYSIAESIFERVCEVTQLDDEQRAALRQLVMRPNDFQIIVVDDDV
jgi:isocitrate/isopropylmalate dehydrogenase